MKGELEHMLRTQSDHEVIDEQGSLRDVLACLRNLASELQLALGLLTVPLSARHMDGAMFETLTTYVKGIVTFNGAVWQMMAVVPLIYKIHILLGFTIFLISPFTRMVHIWSGAGALAYLFRPYQIVRTPHTRAKDPVRL